MHRSSLLLVSSERFPPECVERSFCELRRDGVLRSSLPASNAQATPKIAYLSDTPAPIREYGSPSSPAQAPRTDEHQAKGDGEYRACEQRFRPPTRRAALRLWRVVPGTLPSLATASLATGLGFPLLILDAFEGLGYEALGIFWGRPPSVALDSLVQGRLEQFLGERRLGDVQIVGQPDQLGVLPGTHPHRKRHRLRSPLLDLAFELPDVARNHPAYLVAHLLLLP